MGDSPEGIRGASRRDAERQAQVLLAQPNVTLDTERRFVGNTFLVLRVFRELMAEHDCSNVGAAHRMGSMIRVLDTPPCLLSQIDVTIEGDGWRLVREMPGFHPAICYGDYLREAGYALKRTGSA